MIAIIAVLASLTITTVRGAMRNAKKAAASSNLRQIHQAIILYANDHRDVLPGPASIAIYPWVNLPANPGHTAHLGNFLAPYLGAPPALNFGFLDVLRVPGSPVEHDMDRAPATYVKLDAVDSSPDNIWGQWAGTMQQAADASIRPKRINGLSETARRSSIITTADQESWVSASNTSLPATGIFDGKRLHLFIDGHIKLSSAMRELR